MAASCGPSIDASTGTACCLYSASGVKPPPTSYSYRPCHLSPLFPPSGPYRDMVAVGMTPCKMSSFISWADMNMSSNGSLQKAIIWPLPNTLTYIMTLLSWNNCDKDKDHKKGVRLIC